MIDRDNIIRMAREAGLAALLRDTQKTHEALERFAALVAAAEREACLAECKFGRTSADIEIVIRARSQE